MSKNDTVKTMSTIDSDMKLSSRLPRSADGRAECLAQLDGRLGTELQLFVASIRWWVPLEDLGEYEARSK